MLDRQTEIATPWAPDRAKNIDSQLSYYSKLAVERWRYSKLSTCQYIILLRSAWLTTKAEKFIDNRYLSQSPIEIISGIKQSTNFVGSKVGEGRYIHNAFSQPLYHVIIHSLIIIDWSLIRANSKCRTSNGRASFQSQIKLERNILLVSAQNNKKCYTYSLILGRMSLLVLSVASTTSRRTLLNFSLKKKSCHGIWEREKPYKGKFLAG